jgi:hypothetical protein
MNDAARKKVWKRIMEIWSTNREAVGAMTKQDLRDAVNAADQHVSDDAASYNSDLPQPFRAEATTAQKSFVLQCVLEGRVEAGV